MRKKVTLVHLDPMFNVTPVVGGYLKAYAQAEPEIRHNWDIELYSAHVRTPASQTIQHLVERAPDVVGFSVFTWNVGLVQRLLTTLRGLLAPAVHYILGGVEVMHSAQRYAEISWENVAVCNGEGEQTFKDYLLCLGQQRPELEKVGGLSFPRDGEWITTASHPRITDLDQIPSPYLSGVMDLKNAEIALFETNRGCPFSCEFCYWGGAIGQKVTRIGLDRIKDEISYIARHRLNTLWLVDANFGILPRDIEIAEHIATMRRTCRSPLKVIYSSSKNTSDRNEQISRVFAREGLLTVQAISLQTMDKHTLMLAKRDNIDTETYLRLQRRLNEWGVASMIELIWPLPGETLESFKQGIDDLCASGAQAFNIYPHLWLNNVGYREKTKDLGVVTLKDDDPASGAEIVIQTHQVTYNDYIQGLMFITGIYLLHDCRGLYVTMQLLSALGIASFREVVEKFVTWMRTVSDNAIAGLWRDAENRFEQMHKYIWKGALAHAALHLHRRDLDRLLNSFVLQHPEWFERKPEHADLIRAAVHFDLVGRPYVFAQTPFELGIALENLRVLESRKRCWVVESPFDFAAIVTGLKNQGKLQPSHLNRGRFEITIDHKPGLVFILPEMDQERLYWHCGRSIGAIGNIEARCRTRNLDESVIEPADAVGIARAPLQ